MSGWERSMLAMSGDEQDIQEAVQAVERILHSPRLRNSTRVSLSLALQALRSDPCQEPPSPRTRPQPARTPRAAG
jgi:hypothetical protein